MQDAITARSSSSPDAPQMMPQQLMGLEDDGNSDLNCQKTEI